MRTNGSATRKSWRSDEKRRLIASEKRNKSLRGRRRSGDRFRTLYLFLLAVEPRVFRSLKQNASARNSVGEKKSEKKRK